MPLMTCAPRRAGSEGEVPNSSIVCIYMMQLVIMTTHEPSATRICVRMPAGCEGVRALRTDRKPHDHRAEQAPV